MRLMAQKWIQASIKITLQGLTGHNSCDWKSGDSPSRMVTLRKLLNFSFSVYQKFTKIVQMAFSVLQPLKTLIAHKQNKNDCIEKINIGSEH